MILNTIEKTQEELNKEVANEFVTYLNNVVQGTDNRIKSLASMFWANPVVISEALGSDAVKLFQLLGSLEGLLGAYDSDYVPFVVPYEYTINQDGTVTIGDKIGDEYDSDDEIINEDITE
jgi:hypothetical protein